MATDAAGAGVSLQNGLIESVQDAETGLLRLLHAVGLAPDAHGQAAWPFAHRIATETLAIDAGSTRQLAWAIVAVATALLLVAAGALFRRARWPAWAGAVALPLLMPWPSASLLLADATPTSFHRSPTGFQAASVERGLALYQARCAACHGTDGAGEGPRAASLPMWPPHLDGELLWRRAEGEVFWRVLHGLHDRAGSETMPGFAAQLSDADVWSLIDGIKALAAGQGVRADAAWAAPVRAPDASVHCDDGRLDRRLSDFFGQPLRIVADGPRVRLPNEDPRLVTVVLQQAGAAPAAGCVISDPRAYAAWAQVSGAEPAAFAGAQILVDRGGWLRAYGRPGKSTWSRDDLLCRSTVASAASPSARPPARDGLGELIEAIDADPVRVSALGFAHAR